MKTNEALRKASQSTRCCDEAIDAWLPDEMLSEKACAARVAILRTTLAQLGALLALPRSLGGPSRNEIVEAIRWCHTALQFLEIDAACEALVGLGADAQVASIRSAMDSGRRLGNALLDAQEFVEKARIEEAWKANTPDKKKHVEAMMVVEAVCTRAKEQVWDGFPYGKPKG